MPRRGPVRAALERALEASETHHADLALVELARVYARSIDRDPETLPRLGKEYLATLVELGLSSRRPWAVPKGTNNDVLDELRARRIKAVKTNEGAPDAG